MRRSWRRKTKMLNIKRVKFTKFRDIEARKEKAKSTAGRFLKQIFNLKIFRFLWRKSQNINPLIAILITIAFVTLIFNFHAGMRLKAITVSDRNIEQILLDWNGKELSVRFMEMGLIYAIFLKLVYINIKYYPPITGVLNKGETI